MRDKPIQIIAGPVTAKLVEPDRSVKLLINKELSYLIDGFQFRGAGSWDGRKSFYDFSNDTFPAGFYYRVIKALIANGYKVLPSRIQPPLPLGPDRPQVDSFGDDPRYEYQHETYKKLLNHQQIVAKIATGGGKSRIARLAYRRIYRPTLFMTTRSILMHQMGESFSEMSERIGVIGDGVIKPNFGGMNVGMVQTIAPAIEIQDPVLEYERYEKNKDAAEEREVEELRTHLLAVGDQLSDSEIEFKCQELKKHLYALRKNPEQLAKMVLERVQKHNLDRKWWLDLLNKFEFVILEEAHEASGNSYFEILNNCKRAHYRLSLTATPYMKESAEANLRLEACSGPVAISVSEKQLIDSGILAKPYFKIISLAKQAFPEYQDPKTNRTIKLYPSTPWPLAYEIGITHNSERNSLIVSEAKRAVEHGLSVMVLVNQRKHGKILNVLFAEQKIKSAFIFGEHNHSERKAAIEALKQGKISVLIGSTILDVGVDVPAVGMVIIASAGKAEVALRQRIGRGLRAKKVGPNIAFVIDFDDSKNNHLRAHSRERRQILETTPGFSENIVSDFDYSPFLITHST